MAKMLPRTLEPEVMASEEDARDYDAMNHSEVNVRFCDDLFAAMSLGGARVPDEGTELALDMGTGSAHVVIELARRAPRLNIVAIDLAEHMLALATRNVERAGLADRIRIERADAKATEWSDGAFGLVISNSLVHHVVDVGGTLREMWRLVRPKGLLFVRDLARPESEERLRALVSRYAPAFATADPAICGAQNRQRCLFEASLHAALTVDEVRTAAAGVGIPASAIQMTSDRHWTLAHFRP
ncbi:MAG: methyltransferase domain-containing protein [Myxococcota bacterium]|nr:methyltransferase domain-containing protein [Myxococcota bacterium]